MFNFIQAYTSALTKLQIQDQEEQIKISSFATLEQTNAFLKEHLDHVPRDLILKSFASECSGPLSLERKHSIAPLRPVYNQRRKC